MYPTILNKMVHLTLVIIESKYQKYYYKKLFIKDLFNLSTLNTSVWSWIYIFLVCESV